MLPGNNISTIKTLSSSSLCVEAYSPSLDSFEGQVKRRWLLPGCVILVLIGMCSWSERALRKEAVAHSFLREGLSEVFYLPKKDAVDILSLKYRGVLSDILWFYATNYFGLHFRTDQTYPFLYPYCDLITYLDPSKFHVAKFGALILAWEEGRPDLSILLLDRAVDYYPNNWEPLYYRGFFKYHFLNDVHGALADLRQVVRLPGVDPSVARVVAAIIEQKKSPESSALMLQQMLSTIKDPQIEKVITERLEKSKRKLAGGEK
jgi:hypothetical protein